MKKVQFLGVCSVIFSFIFMFNVVQAQDIVKADIINNLDSLQVSTNLNDIADVSSASGLYFVKNGIGKIIFNSTLNLNSDENSDVLNNVTTTLAFSERAITFNPIAPSDFTSTSVTVFVYGLKGSFYTVDDLIFSGASPEVTNLTYSGHTLSFNIDRFVSFSVADKPDTQAPIISFVSPTPAHNSNSNVDPAVIKISSDENLSKAVIQVGYYDNGDLEMGTTTGFTVDSSKYWKIDKTIVHSGSNSLKIGYSEESWPSSDSWLKKTLILDSPATVYFYWKVYTEGNEVVGSRLSLRVNGDLNEAISGTQDWQLKKVQLNAGTHELKWNFEKAPIGANGSTDGGWIDDVITFIDPSSTNMSILNNNELTTAQHSISSLSQGKNYYQVLAVDEAGNEYVSYPSKVINFDSIAPRAVLSNLPAGVTYGTNLSITVSGADVVQYKYKLDNGEYSEPISVENKLIKSPISAGKHVIYVIGSDSVGNWQVEPTTHSWEIVAYAGRTVNTNLYPSTGSTSVSPITVAPPSISSNPLNIKPTVTAPQINLAPKVLGIKSVPNGSLIRISSSGRIYLIINNQKQYISNLKELKKYNGRKMFHVTAEMAGQYLDYRANGTLLRTSDFKIFVINNGKKKHIVSLEDLKKNYKGKPIINIPDGVIGQYPNI